jgi:hypothetical protein
MTHNPNEINDGQHERLVGRLRELADAVTQGRDAVAREFTMRVPAEPERDADLVLSKAADEIERLRAEGEALRSDAERYRWLRGNAYVWGNNATEYSQQEWIAMWIKGNIDFDDFEIDAAIDAAIRAR